MAIHRLLWANDKYFFLFYVTWYGYRYRGLAWNRESQKLFGAADVSNNATTNTNHGLHLVC